MAEGETVRWMNQAIERLWPIFLEDLASQILLVPMSSFLDRFKPWTAVWIILIFTKPLSALLFTPLRRSVLHYSNGGLGANVHVCGLMDVEKNYSSEPLSWKDSSNRNDGPVTGGDC